MAGPRVFSTRREHFADRAQGAEASDRADVARRLNDCPFLLGRLISVKLASGVAKTLRHGLGVPAAFFVIRANYDGTGTVANVTESSTAFQAKLDLTSQISIVASAACRVDLWVYPRASKPIDATTGQSA